MKIAVAGYGALGAATEKVIHNGDDVELVGIFTRRNVAEIRTPYHTSAYPFNKIKEHKSEIDVVINCMGSAYDLPETTPFLADTFNLIDSFDTHSQVRAHFNKTDAAAKSGGKLSLICAGWDPGMFSILRAYMRAVLSNGVDYTFWGKGVSRGHSNAIKRILGVVDAVQYTIPISSVLSHVRNGENPQLKANEMHKRVCYVVAEPGADTDRIEREIKTMPDYFADYQTEVNFIDYESFLSEHTKEEHAGNVICCESDEGINSVMEFSLKLDSNPYFTAQVLVCYARAVMRLNRAGECGCITPLDIKPKDLLFKEDIFKII